MHYDGDSLFPDTEHSAQEVTFNTPYTEAGVLDQLNHFMDKMESGGGKRKVVTRSQAVRL